MRTESCLRSSPADNFRSQLLRSHRFCSGHRYPLPERLFSIMCYSDNSLLEMNVYVGARCAEEVRSVIGCHHVKFVGCWFH